MPMNGHSRFPVQLFGSFRIVSRKVKPVWCPLRYASSFMQMQIILVEISDKLLSYFRLGPVEIRRKGQNNSASLYYNMLARPLTLSHVTRYNADQSPFF